MSVNWIRLYELSNENNKITGSRFEKLVLDYLNKYYKEYDWENTQSSWDDNRDFISLILENIWAEAKYKKNCNALKKTDIDPTMISGLLNGKVKVIFFLTNGYLPPTLKERIKNAERMYFIRVICITKVQLEYWLCLHPDIYKNHFLEKLDITDEYLPAALITEIEIVDPVNSNNNLLALKHELFEQQFYVLYITIEANTSTEIAIIDSDYPFSFINSVGYANYECISIQPGIQHLKFLIYTTNCCDETIELKYKMNDEAPLVFAFSVNICMNDAVKLVYSEQLAYKEKIIKLLSGKNPNGRLILLGGNQGFGKTHLLKEIMQHFYSKRQIMYFSFYPLGDYRNTLEICRLIIYINFGEVVNYFKKNITSNTIDYFKHLLRERLDPESGDIDLILEIIDGCYDEICAQKVKKNLLTNSKLINKVILHKTTPLEHLALLDNTERLSKPEYDLIKNIIECATICNNIRFLVCSQNEKNDYDFYLNGLTVGDIKKSLSYNLTNWTPAFIEVISKETPRCPAAFIDIVEVFKQYIDKENDLDIVEKYIHLSDNARSVTLYKSCFRHDQNLLEIVSFIYLFENGLPYEILVDLGVSNEQISILKKEQYIKYSFGNLKSFSKLYRNAFLKENLQKCTDYIAKCLDIISNNASKYEKLIFLPDIYTKYIEIGKGNELNVSVNLLEHMRQYSYVCDYKNMYVHGQTAYYFLNQKDVEELSETDYMILFYYGISLLHCDRKRGAIEIFRKIKNNTSLELNVNIMARCELYNNLYNLFQISHLEGEILISLADLKRKINSIKDETDYSALDIRIAYSTCMNRYMMILFMQDKIIDATKIFKEYVMYNNEIPASQYSYKYHSMMGEWLLDYARGISWQYPACAKKLYNISIELLRNGKNKKRYLLAQMDLAFLQCVYFDKYDEINTIHSITDTLKTDNYINEYFRGIIREKLCRLVQYFKDPHIANSEGIITIAQKYKEEALTAELDSMLYINGRLAYQTRMYFSVLATIIKNFAEASEYLDQNLRVTSEDGASFKKIITHNLKNLKQIEHIEWGTANGCYSTHTFILDPRIW